jgi:hypothetical protein
MKKLWWFSRVLAIATGLYLVLAFGSGSMQQPAKADPGCNPSNCTSGVPQGGACQCNNPGCNECVIPSGGSGCGTCSKSQDEIE